MPSEKLRGLALPAAAGSTFWDKPPAASGVGPMLRPPSELPSWAAAVSLLEELAEGTENRGKGIEAAPMGSLPVVPLSWELPATDAPWDLLGDAACVFAALLDLRGVLWGLVLPAFASAMPIEKVNPGADSKLEAWLKV